MVCVIHEGDPEPTDIARNGNVVLDLHERLHHRRSKRIGRR